MINCKKCGISANERMLHRTQPTGQPDGGFMCMPCIQREEPELARNIKSDESYPVSNAVEDIVLGKRR